jgi:hypothetical protein
MQLVVQVFSWIVCQSFLFRLGRVTKYIVDLDFFDVCFNFKNCVCHANDVAN